MTLITTDGSADHQIRLRITAALITESDQLGQASGDRASHAHTGDENEMARDPGVRVHVYLGGHVAVNN